MRLEGRVAGCEACRELRLEEMNRNEDVGQTKVASNTGPVQSSKTVDSSARSNFLTSKRRILPGGRFEGEPEWWGVGVNRIISVKPNGMYVEEVEKDLCERTYSARTKKSLADRQSWAEFMALMQKRYEEALSRSQGPEWFQDLSFRQMELFEKMHEIIETDLQEELCARTQRALYDIGVYPPLSNKAVKNCMQDCMSNMIRFIFLIHKLVVEREQGPFDEEFREAIQENRPVQQFSINERILLSGVFHLHFEEFISKLDKLLPAPPEKPKLMLPRKPRPPPKKVYDSPYLEPMPINPKVWYVQRAEDDLYKEQARLVALQEKREFEKKVLEQAEVQKRLKEEKLRKLLEQKNYTFGTSSKLLKKSAGSTQEFPISVRETKSQTFRRFSKGGEDKRSSISSKSKSSLDSFKSLYHFKKNRRYMYDVVHGAAQTKTSYGGFFTHDNKLLKDSEGANLKIRLVPRNDKVVCLYRDEDFKPVQVLDTRVRTCCRDVGVQTTPESIFLPLHVTQGAEFIRLSENEPSKSDASTNTHERDEPEVIIESHLEKVVSNVIKEPPVQKPLNVECTDEDCALVQGGVPMDEFDMMRNKIITYPPEKQLKAAVAFLCRRGDPMAVLPKLEETPWLVRWYELRRGIKEKLTNEDKDDLMMVSRKQWMSGYKRVSSVTAKPFRVKRNITTLDKNYYTNKINSYTKDYQRQIRQQMVNNSRDYFPTFFTEYFPSPLNRNLRKTFFTYLPSREMDPYVYRVWGGESRNMVKKKDAEPKEDGSA